MRRDWADLILRVGLAFAFLYPPVNALSDPFTWIGYFPREIVSLAQSFGITDLVLLHTFGVVEISLALWVLSGWKIFWPSVGAFLVLLAIVVSDLSGFQILFRDVSIMAIALSLAYTHRPKQYQHEIFG